MQKLNRPTNLSYPWFIILFICVFVVFLRIRGGTTDSIDTILILGAFGSLVTGICIFIGNLIFRARQYVALSTLPKARPSISLSPATFSRTNLPPPPRDPPEMRNELMEFFNNDRNLSEYIGTLGPTKIEIDNALSMAVLKYNADRSLLEDQQIDLYRMAHMANRITRKAVRLFPRLSSNLTSVPSVRSLIVPRRPSIMTPADYGRRFTRISHAAANVGRNLATSGNANPMTMVLLFAGTVAMTAVQFQRAVREMHETVGELHNYLDAAGNELDMLARAHEEMVQISDAITLQSDEVRELIPWAQQELRSRHTAPPTESLFRRLAQFALLSQLQSSNAI